MPTKKVKDKDPKWQKLVFMAVLAILPFIAFHPVLDADFINLDDGRFIQNNTVVNEGSLSNIPQAFKEQIFTPHYKPLVYTSWIIEATLFGMDPFIYHFDNLLLHILNTFLIFFIFQKLLARSKIDEHHIMIAAFFGALLYSLHPFKVESVAWAVERKDVLFSFFLFSGMLSYITYIDSKKRKYLFLTMGFYILTLLSKSMGISLIIIVFLLDFLYARKFGKRLFVEKVPFIIIVVAALFIYGIFEKYDRVTLGVTEGLLSEEQQVIQPENFDGLHPFYKQFLVMNYRMIGFVAHFVYPTKLSITYPRAYYLDMVGGFIHALPFLNLLLLLGILWMWQRARWLAFGAAFYFLTIFPALMMGDKGTNFLPDRYVYMPSFGLVFLFITAVFTYVSERYFKLSLALLSVVIMLCSYSVFNYSHAWKDSLTLWSDAIEKYPGMLEVAYKNRGLEYRKRNRMDLALQDYLILEKMRVREAGVYGNIANIYGSLQNFDKSQEYYTKAIQHDENYATAYLNRGITYAQRKMFDLAFADFQKAYSLDSTSPKLLESYAYANFEVGNYALSTKLYSELINAGVQLERVYFQRGLAFFSAKEFTKAVEDFIQVVSFNPSNQDALYNISASYFQLGEYSKAMDFANRAAQNGFNVPQSFYQKIQEGLQAE
ncbi:MAG: tetratricopeptide repeat protein [Chitinophagales bacterium]|nr:tetratricopeptide repeat protein [Chitinophagales bacterium]